MQQLCAVCLQPRLRQRSFEVPLDHLARARRKARGAVHGAAGEETLEHIAARREAHHACEWGVDESHG